MIKTLLNIEYRKAINYKTFWILGVLHFILVCILTIFVKELSDAFNLSTPKKGVVITSNLKVYLFFPKIWNTLTFVSSMLHILLGTMVIISICNEFSYKTIRHNIVSGLSKREFLYSKLIFCLCLSLYATVLILALGLIIGLINTPNLTFNKIIAQWQFIPLYSLQTFLYLMLALLIGLLFKKAALGISFLFVYVFLIENIISFFFHSSIENYFPYEVISGLIPAPDHFQENSSAVVLLSTIAAAIIYLVLYTFISNLVLKREDL